MRLAHAARHTLALPAAPDGRPGGAVTYVRGETLAAAHRALVRDEDRALFHPPPRRARRAAAPPDGQPSVPPASPEATAPAPDADR